MVQESQAEFDTIAALATPAGEGAIAVIRVSGDDAVPVVNQLFKGKDLTKVNSHTLNYGHIVDPETGVEVDEVLAGVMLAPKTFTREDVVEINTHGGIVATQRVLELVLAHGARLAEPGEFTKRAFLHGRIDLAQAEAVMDLISAKTNRSLEVAVGQLDGALSRLIKQLRGELLNALAEVEVNIDYPEYDDAETVTSDLMKKKAVAVKAKIEALLRTAKQGKILRDGVATAIIGRPNVGKSSLLNRLLHEDKAIVTDVAGTTRDVIEEYVNVAGLPLKLIDTAGIRATDDTVEKIGVERSKKALAQADLVLLVLNQSEPLTDQDKDLLAQTAHKQRLILLNKSDLHPKLDLSEIKAQEDAENIIAISVEKNTGFEDFERRLSALYSAGLETTAQEAAMVTNARQVGLLTKAAQSLDAVLDGLEAGMPVDLVQIDLTSAWETLGEITGDSYQDELLDQLFSQFCLGK